jgi:uncharacterized membrane protein (DUF485 family)
MSTNIDLKELWSRKNAVAPDENEIRLKAEKLKMRIRNKSILAVATLLFTIVFILLVLFSSDFQMLSTRIGVTIIIVGIALGVVHFTKLVYLLSEKNTTSDTNTYLQLMLKAKQQQEFMQTKIMNNYFALLSIGLLFYMYEPSVRMSLVAKVITYAVTFGWIGFNWFYLRPRIVKKQLARMNTVIESLQNISKSLTTLE